MSIKPFNMSIKPTSELKEESIPFLNSFWHLHSFTFPSPPLKVSCIVVESRVMFVWNRGHSECFSGQAIRQRLRSMLLWTHLSEVKRVTLKMERGFRLNLDLDGLPPINLNLLNLKAKGGTHSPSYHLGWLS